jgi:hypothetical protein
MRCLILFFIVISTITQGSAQGNDFTTDDFMVTGDAVSAGEQCFRLTEDALWNGGGLWYKSKVDLSNPFTMELEMTFGCRDEEGADGIVFIFHPYLTTGFAGEGMGFGGLFPSFGVEMDTYQNYHLDDPWYDHVALVQHGSLRHQYGITAPIAMKNKVMNVEDCDYHRVKIDWQPQINQFSFFFDGELRIRHSIDLIKEIFDGSPEVYWGFTSATGGKTNKHMVCLKKLIFTETFALSKKDQLNLSKGHEYILRNLNFASGRTQLPPSALKELDRLVNFFKQYPDHTIIVEGFTDSSGDPGRNERLSKKRAETIAQYFQSKGIDPDRMLIFGQGEAKPIAPNTTPEGRLKNRRIELRMRKLGA